MSFSLRVVVLSTATLALALSIWPPPAAGATTGEQPDLKAGFLRLCDDHCKIIERQARTDQREGRAFYWDSYVVRALCVAYDMTGDHKYLDACKRWSDRMLEYQSRMIPKHAYYMQYGRAPGQDKGDWYVADCATIAMGVLATAARCDDPVESARYLDSVKAFAELVIDNWVRPSGGVFRSAGLSALRRDRRRVVPEDRPGRDRLAQPSGLPDRCRALSTEANQANRDDVLSGGVLGGFSSRGPGQRTMQGGHDPVGQIT